MRSKTCASLFHSVRTLIRGILLSKPLSSRLTVIFFNRLGQRRTPTVGLQERSWESTMILCLGLPRYSLVQRFLLPSCFITDYSRLLSLFWGAQGPSNVLKASLFGYQGPDDTFVYTLPHPNTSGIQSVRRSDFELESVQTGDVLLTSFGIVLCICTHSFIFLFRRHFA